MRQDLAQQEMELLCPEESNKEHKVRNDSTDQQFHQEALNIPYRDQAVQPPGDQARKDQNGAVQEVLSEIAPDGAFETISVQHVRLYPEAGRQGAHDRTDKDAYHSENEVQSDGGNQVHCRFKQRLVPIIPEKAEGVFERNYTFPHS